ncbi:MAG: hypothetical protein AAF738_04305, partial [Bacteroidota bacterium]
MAVQNWSQTNPNNTTAGSVYTIDFSPSQDVIGIINEDPPEVDRWIEEPSEICDNDIVIGFDDEVKCNSFNTLNFSLIGPEGESYTVRQNTVVECRDGSSSILRLRILPSPKNIGEYTLTLNTQLSTNFVIEDICGNINTQSVQELETVFRRTFTISEYTIQDLFVDAATDNVCDGGVRLSPDRPGFFVSIGYSFEWSRINADGSTTSVATTESYTATEPGTYRVRAESGCTVGTAEITLTGGANADLGNAISGVCNGEAVEIGPIDNGPDATYTWDDGFTGRLRTVTTPGLYRVTVATNCGNPDEGEIQVSYNAAIDYNPNTSPQVCPGATRDIGTNIGGGATYAWNTGATSPTINAGVGNYQVTVTQNGCSVERTIVVTEATLPDVRISGANTVCPSGGANQETTITALDGNFTGATFRWDNNSTSPARRVGAGTYTVTATTAAGCTDMASITVGTHTIIPATINGQQNFTEDICAGDDIALNASAGQSYQWSVGNTGNSITRGAGTYSVVVTDNNGCESTAQATITEVAAPQINVTTARNCSPDRQTYSFTVTTPPGITLEVRSGTGGVSGGPGSYAVNGVPSGEGITLVAENSIGCEITQTVMPHSCACPPVSEPTSVDNVQICADATAAQPLRVNVNLQANEEVRWYDSQFGGTLLTTGQQYTPNTTTPNSYFVEVYNTLTNCNSNQRIEVRLENYPALQANITGDTNICPTGTGDPIQLEASLSGGTIRQVLWSNNQNTPTITVNAPGNYSVEITDQNDCTTNASTTVGAYPAPVANITGDFNFCPGENATLTASGGQNYEWNTGVTGSILRPNAAQTYTVVVTDANGCEAQASQAVTQNAEPQITLANNATECAPDRQTYLIRATVSAGSTLMVDGNIGNVQDNGTAYTITGLPAGQDVVLIATNGAGCSIQQPVQARNCACPNIAAPTTANASRAICADAAFPALTVDNIGGNPDLQVRWFDAASGGTQLATGTSYTPNAAGTYYAEVYNTTSNCNSQRTPITLNINPLPTATITTPNMAVCPGQETTLDAGNADRYVWSSGATTRSIMAGTGTYSVTITDTNGCTAEDDITVTQHTVAPASITGNLAVCPSEQTTLTASAGQSYQWSNNAPSDRITVGIGTYTVTVTDANGCSAEASATVDTYQVTNVEIIGTTEVCPDGMSMTTLTAINGETFLWEGTS